MTAFGIAVSTIGRPELARLLDSLAAGVPHPAAVAIANQSGGPLPIDASGYPFPVTVVDSSGGLSAGRNAAVAALPPSVEVVGFPNDDSSYPPGLLAAVGEAFAARDRPAVVACTYRVDDRSVLPADGVRLDRHSVWRAAEPAMFVRRSVLDAVGGFRTDLGVGSAGRWQSGEGTDLVLRIMASGGVAVSAASKRVDGPGERRSLSDAEFVAKARRYARGTGRVYRLHGYPLRDLVRTVVGPWVQLLRRPRSISRLSVALAWNRSLGRLEGFFAR